jgi:hypothetical protein
LFGPWNQNSMRGQMNHSISYIWATHCSFEFVVIWTKTLNLFDIVLSIRWTNRRTVYLSCVFLT